MITSIKNPEVWKKKGKNGFSLAETLVAVLILLMVSAVVAAGIPVAKNAYEKVTIASNAEVLLSTTVSALRDELGTGRNITTDENKKSVSYYSTRTGNHSSIFLGSLADDDTVYTILLEYSVFTEKSEEKIQRQLVSAAASTKDLTITYDAITYKNGLVYITGLKVTRKSNEKVYASMEELIIRPVVQ